MKARKVSTSSHVILSVPELALLLEALDSHEYWQLSDPDKRSDGHVLGTGSSNPANRKAIAATRKLAARLNEAKRGAEELARIAKGALDSRADRVSEVSDPYPRPALPPEAVLLPREAVAPALLALVLSALDVSGPLRAQRFGSRWCLVGRGVFTVVDSEAHAHALAAELFPGEEVF